MAKIFKDLNLKRVGKNDLVDVAKELNDKIVAVYFSAHWCPPCNNFTPLLKTFYEEIVKDEQFEIIFVSLDRTESEQIKYLMESHGNWLYILFENSERSDIAKNFDINTIPTLLVLRPDGTVMVEDGRNDVSTKPAQVAFSEWKSKL